MVKCKSCGQAMVRIDIYDPYGTIPLKSVEIKGKKWTCISQICYGKTHIGGDKNG